MAVDPDYCSQIFGRVNSNISFHTPPQFLEVVAKYYLNGSDGTIMDEDCKESQ